DTDNPDCLLGQKRWNYHLLTQNSLDASLWNGPLTLGLSDAHVADHVRFIVFAVGDAGAVSWATNQGLYYTPGGPVDRLATSLVLDPPATATGPVGSTVMVSATLYDQDGLPLGGQNVLFGLASQTRVGVTNGSGQVTAELPIFGIPGPYDITAAFTGSAAYAPSTAAPQDFAIEQQTTAITLELGAGLPNEDAALIATLVDGTTPDPNILVEQTIFFHFTDAGGATTTKTSITGLLGEARLGRNGIVDGLAPGTYSVVAEFKGSPSYEGSFSNSVQYVVNLPPVCYHDPETKLIPLFSADPSTIWPLKKQDMEQVSVIGQSSAVQIVDPEGGPITIVFLDIFQDETLTNGYLFDGEIEGPNQSIAKVRKDRNGNGNGRVYHVIFAAVDQEGAFCTGDLTVPTVPHDQSGDASFDDGCLYNSITGAPVDATTSCAILRDSATVPDEIVEAIIAAGPQTPAVPLANVGADGDTVLLPAVSSEQAELGAESVTEDPSVHLPFVTTK
ncbi:MAG: Ig-like domain-containing protein, partial [Planctomycetes bacterium]|nr:Ig-like domain-containing protein [Planctomycetota bacterium]